MAFDLATRVLFVELADDMFGVGGIVAGVLFTEVAAGSDLHARSSQDSPLFVVARRESFSRRMFHTGAPCIPPRPTPIAPGPSFCGIESRVSPDAAPLELRLKQGKRGLCTLGAESREDDAGTHVRDGGLQAVGERARGFHDRDRRQTQRTGR
ncbi:hypothetical protein [Leucobacter chromiireducens]|uniref:hypothetical protein n=1 Tax=Leucobacter chromiireducens TaxID=283877 RepID=UPI003CD06EAD